jgi:hypothetical protein
MLRHLLLILLLPLCVMILLLLLLSAQPVPQTAPTNIPPEQIAPAQRDPLFEHLSDLHPPEKNEPASKPQEPVAK